MTWNLIRLKILFPASILVILSGCTSSQPAPVMSLTQQLREMSAPDYRLLERGSYHQNYYEVQKGDTLYFIAYITNQDVKDLIATNQLAPPHTIFPGQKLKIWRDQASGLAKQNHSSDVIITPLPSKPSLPAEPSSVESKTHLTAPNIPATDQPKVETPIQIVKNSVQNSPSSTTKVESKLESSVTSATKPRPAPVAKQAETKKELNSKNTTNISQNVSQKKSGSASQKLEEVEVQKSKEYSQSVTTQKPKPNKPITTPKVTNGKLTWKWPTKGRIISGFSNSESGNKGLDIAGSLGQDVVAAADGKVVYAGNALRGYGNLIIIKHNNDYLSAYAHNDNLVVSERQDVKQGQKIASMGSTGTDSVRLHFEVRYKGKSVNPLRYLPKR